MNSETSVCTTPRMHSLILVGLTFGGRGKDTSRLILFRMFFLQLDYHYSESVRYLSKQHEVTSLLLLEVYGYSKGLIVVLDVVDKSRCSVWLIEADDVGRMLGLDQLNAFPVENTVQF